MAKKATNPKKSGADTRSKSTKVKAGGTKPRSPKSTAAGRKSSGEKSTGSIRKAFATRRKKITEEAIRQRAYEIYLERGDAPGSAEEDWIQAEIELKAKK